MLSTLLFSSNKKLAGIEYFGTAGISEHCLRAIKRLIQNDENIEEARVLSAHQVHCFLLRLEQGGLIAVKSGFSSGYNGEGPRAFARALKLLANYGVEVEEYIVPSQLLERLDASALTEKDLGLVSAATPVRPIRIYDYVYDAGLSSFDLKGFKQEFPAVMPWAIIDPRLVDLALKFFEDPDGSVLTGFRRLEDIVRGRLKSEAQQITRVFAQAFQGEKSLLTWKDIDPGEHTGRGQMFTGIYSAYRNPRAHRVLGSDNSSVLSEFLMLNQLYLLESTAVAR